MPKVKCSTASRLRAFVQEFGHNIFSTDGPDRSTLRKNYVSICYDETIQMIRS